MPQSRHPPHKRLHLAHLLPVASLLLLCTQIIQRAAFKDKPDSYRFELDEITDKNKYYICYVSLTYSV